MLDMRYRVEIEGEETVWMWHYPAAHAKADSASHYDAERKFHSDRVRTVKITDEGTGRVEFYRYPDAEGSIPSVAARGD